MNTNFSRQLLKGKITEAIFEEMFRVSEEFSVIHIGYEYTVPVLAQFQHHIQIQQVLQNIRKTPDFTLISQDKSRVYLVEVKYRHTLEQEEILHLAQDLVSKWNPIFLFLATQDNFYFESCKSIIENNGNIQLLPEAWIDKAIQTQYQSLLKEFIH